MIESAASGKSISQIPAWRFCYWGALGALFGLALLVLALRPASRTSGIAGSAVAMAIGVAWFVRGLLLPGPAGIALAKEIGRAHV